MSPLLKSNDEVRMVSQNCEVFPALEICSLKVPSKNSVAKETQASDVDHFICHGKADEGPAQNLPRRR